MGVRYFQTDGWEKAFARNQKL